MGDLIDGWIRVQQVRRDKTLESHTWWTSWRASYEEAEYSLHYRVGLDKAHEFFGDGDASVKRGRIVRTPSGCTVEIQLNEWA